MRRGRNKQEEKNSPITEAVFPLNLATGPGSLSIDIMTGLDPTRPALLRSNWHQRADDSSVGYER